MARRLRIPKNETGRVNEAMSQYTFLYEDGDAMIFEVSDDSAEKAAAQTGGLLNLDE